MAFLGVKDQEKEKETDEEYLESMKRVMESNAGK